MTQATLTELTQTRAGKPFPASAFLYVGDRQKPSTWKLPFKEYVGEALKVTARKLSQAWLAVTKGFRGRRVQGIPQTALSAIRARIIRMGKSIGWKPPSQREELRHPERWNLREDVAGWDAGKIDREARTIADAVLAGPVSKNGRKYLTKALAEALPLYEGARVFINHSDGNRDVRDLLGWVTGAKIAEGKVKGTVHLIPGADADKFIEVASANPKLLGMSHTARGVVRKHKDEHIVERITEVSSVDVVTDPATTRSIFEDKSQQEGDEPMTRDEIMDKHPDLIEELREDIRREITAELEGENLKGQVAALTKKVGELQEENKTLREEQKAQESTRLLETMLSNRKWPDEAKDLARERLKGRICDEKEIEEALKGCEAMAHAFGANGKGTKAPIIIESDEGSSGSTEYALAEACIFGLAGAEKPKPEKKAEGD